MWETIRADEFCDSVRDGTHDTPKQVENGYKLVTGKHIIDGIIDPTDAYYISEKDYMKISERSKVEKWDVLMSMIGNGLGRSAVVTDTPDYAIKNIALFKVGEEIKAKWLHYFLSGKDGQGLIYNSLQGSGQPFISLSNLRAFPIPNAPYEHMEKVVGVLSKYDSLTENNQKQIKLLEEAAQRLYKEWFVDLRFPGYEDAEIIDEIPMGWNETTIDSFIELQSGYAFKSSSFDDAGNYKIVTIKNVQDGAFDGDNVNKILEIPDKMPPHCKLQEGDSLLSLTGNVGRVCTVIGDNYLLNQRVAKIVSEYPCFSYCLFRSDKMFHDMNNLANGAAQQNLSPIRTGQLRIIKPDDETILKFEQMVKPILNKKNILNRDILIAAQARNRLLPKLMNGEIEV